MYETDSVIRCLINSSRELCSLPAVALKVLELTNSPQVDAKQLKDCIEKDPALTSKILRVVNSSLFGLSQQVSDLNQALALLGTKPLKLLVLGFSLPAGITSTLSTRSLEQYWAHSLTKAVAAREISQSIWGIPGDETFIIGLLQDIGELVLLQQLGEPYAGFLDSVREEGGDLRYMERESLGFDHCKISAQLLSSWGMPESIVRAVEQDYDHDLEAGESLRKGKRLTEEERLIDRILHAAELATQLLVDEKTNVLPALLSTARSQRSVTDDEWNHLLENLQEKVRQLGDILSLKLPGDQDYRDIIGVAHVRLSEVAAEVASEAVRRRVNEAAESRDNSRLSHKAQSLSQAAQRWSQRQTQDETQLGGIDRMTRLISDLEGQEKPETSAETADANGARKETSASPRKDAPAAGITPGEFLSGRFVVEEEDQTLLMHVTAGVKNCRQRRQPLTLMLLELDHFEQVLFQLAPDGVERLMESIQQVLREFEVPGLSCLRTKDSRLATLLPGMDRVTAVDFGNQFRNRIQRERKIHPKLWKEATFSLGLATVPLPSKNFPATELTLGAARCLRGAQSSGGGGIKSIEIF